MNFYADVFGGALSLHTCHDFGRPEGIMLSLLGTAEPTVLHEWFDRLSVDGSVLDPLSPKPWGASDGQVIDRHGLHWLVGYEPAT
ncbi:hypothetical protein [Arthrobacter sp. AK04]|uniref:hypothetical protein n=1 Tax=Arthrobacter sp. AK04 TaxID=2900048 RepID=UPI0025711DD7|nr:hypothetical protein [Arthrobacter sp. AK04]